MMGPAGLARVTEIHSWCFQTENITEADDKLSLLAEQMLARVAPEDRFRRQSSLRGRLARATKAALENR